VGYFWGIMWWRKIEKKKIKRKGEEAERKEDYGKEQHHDRELGRKLIQVLVGGNERSQVYKLI